MAEITKVKKITYKITFAVPDTFCFDEEFKRIRSRFKYKCTACFSCGHKFTDNEMIGSIATSKGNKVVCNKCAEKFKRELEGEQNG